VDNFYDISYFRFSFAASRRHFRLTFVVFSPLSHDFTNKKRTKSERLRQVDDSPQEYDNLSIFHLTLSGGYGGSGLRLGFLLLNVWVPFVFFGVHLGVRS